MQSIIQKEGVFVTNEGNLKAEEDIARLRGLSGPTAIILVAEEIAV